jgi:ABC-type branched-subunit amino acid transport system substrate-binding protein
VISSRHAVAKRTTVLRQGSASVLLMLLTLLLLWSASGVSVAATEPADGPLQQGLHYYRIGELDRAQAVLLDYLAGQTDPDLEPEALLMLARIYQQRGRYDQVLHYLQRVPKALRGSETRLLEGAALIRLGRSEEGLALLSEIDDSRLSRTDQGRRLADMATGHLDQQHWLQALYFIHAYLPLAVERDQTDTLLRRTGEVVTEQLSDAQLAEAAFMFQGSAVGQAAGLQLALRSWRAGDELAARRQIETVLQQPNAFPGREEAVKLRDRLFGAPVKSRVLGVILPLSGRYAAFGKAVRRGIELALEQLGNAEFPVKLLFRDSAGDADRSARAVSELANGEQALAVLGPLTGTAAEAAAARAQLERLPLLTLSQRNGLAETGPYVFRSSLTSALQAQALARYAIEERGLRSFAVLAPDNRLGREMSSRFAAEIEQRGGQIVASRSYAAEATDFRRQILLLKGEDPDAPEQPETPATPEVEQELPPLPFEALFIPDYAERVGLIAPQLAYYEIRDVTLLGINGWNDPELLRLAGVYVEGAVFCDGFYRYSPYPFVQAFVNSYFERFGEEPTILEAQGYDAAGILLAQLSRGEQLTRDDLRNALSRLQNYPGVAGATSFDAQGDAQKVLFLLQVQNGNIVQIN